MDRIRLLLLLILPVALVYEQNQYSLKFERVEGKGFDQNHIGFLNVKTFKFNRTQACVNITVKFKTEFANTLQVEVQAYRFASNEYREFPLRFMFDFCKLAKKDDFGLRNLFKYGNLTGCPLKKGVYHTGYWYPNASRFPPYVPGGSCMLDLKYFYYSVEVMFFQLYTTIKYPEV